MGLLAAGVACNGNKPANPTSPSATSSGTNGSATDGFALKAGTPNAISPTGGATADNPITLTASTTTGTYGSIQLSYHFQVRSGSTVVSEGTVGPIAGSTVSFQPTGLDFQVTYTWRVQATYNGAGAPWSADATFVTPAGAYIRGAELRDPLTIGSTVGTVVGNVTFGANGATLNDASSWIQYQLPVTLQAGQFSMEITGLSTKVHGAKSSVMAMGEGFANITTNDYRMTGDFRARDYPDPGAVTCRFITGDATNRIFDCTPRIQVSGWDPAKVYLWTFTWSTGTMNLKVVEEGTGRVMYNVTNATGSHAYNPQPHVLYVGKPVPRGGEVDGTAWPITVKNVWASANPRPNF
jgi:hypothetical protein